MASSSSASSSMLSGRHNVLIGSSLGRAIKSRKLKGSPAPTTKRSNLPEIDFYSFKFNFKASSIDTTKPATIEIKKGTENSRVVAEYPSTSPGEVQLFNGAEHSAKEVDCILIFDEETGKYTLEKLDSFVILKSEGKKAVSPRSSSPAPVAPSVSPSKGKAKQEDYGVDQTMSGLDEDAEGEADDFEEVIPPSVAFRYEDEEEEEGEEIEIPLRQVIPPKPQPPPPKTARAVKPLPSRVEAKAPAATPPQPAKSKIPPPPALPPAAIAAPPPTVAPAPSKAKSAQPKPKKAKPITSVSTTIPASSTSFAAEEVMEFGKPAKRARQSMPQQPPPPKPEPTPRSPVGLSLPGGSTSFAPPPAPASSKPSALPSSRSAPAVFQLASVPASPVLVAQADTSEDEEDWEQVPTATPDLAQDGNGSAGLDLSLEEELEEDIFGDGFGEADADAEQDGDGEGEEIDMNTFAMELDEQMEESEGDVEDDFLAAAVSPEPERQPISQNRLASGAGAAVGDTDDEYSSSEESDED